MTSTDRKLLLGAACVAFVLMAGTIAFTPPEQQEAVAVPTTYSSTSGGAMASYLLLREMHYPVRRWEEPTSNLRRVDSRAVLILAEPTEMPSRAEREALRQFVTNGGTVLFCGGAIRAFFREADVRPESLTFEWKEFSPALPNAFSRGAEKIAMQVKAYWGPLFSSQMPLYGNAARPVVLLWRMGAGKIIWWASATPLTNAGITRANNLALFLNTVRGDGSSQHPIYWDEYFHGQRGSLWSYIARTPIPWLLPQIALAAIAVVLTFSRRSGPVFVPLSESRLSPLEFVLTMGGLYQRAKATPVAVAVAYRRLRLTLSRRLGVASTIADEHLANAAGERLGFDATKLGLTLRDASAAANMEKFPARRALKLVQDLDSLAVQLNSPRLSIEEKK